MLGEKSQKFGQKLNTELWVGVFFWFVGGHLPSQNRKVSKLEAGPAESAYGRGRGELWVEKHIPDSGDEGAGGVLKSRVFNQCREEKNLPVLMSGRGANTES